MEDPTEREVSGHCHSFVEIRIRNVVATSGICCFAPFRGCVPRGIWATVLLWLQFLFFSFWLWQPDGFSYIILVVVNLPRDLVEFYMTYFQIVEDTEGTRVNECLEASMEIILDADVEGGMFSSHFLVQWFISFRVFCHCVPRFGS